MANWYYRIRNEEFGPVEDLGLAALLADGSLHPTDEVRRDGEFEWRPASAALSFHASKTSAQEWSEGDLDQLLVAETPVAKHRAAGHVGLATATEEALDQRFDDPTIAGEADLNMLGVEDPSIPKRVRPAPVIAPADHEPTNDEPGWYYKSLGQELGPVAYSEILQLAENGELTPNDFVRPGADGAWQRAGRISGLFPDNYAETQARLKEAAAKMAISSQRLGEKGLAALAAEIEKPAPPAAAEDEDPPAPKSKKSSKKSKKKSPKITDADEFAASILAEESEEEAPPPRPRAEARSHVPAVAHAAAAAPDIPSTETRPLNSVQTPLPPTRSFTPPPPTSAPAFKRAASKPTSRGGGGFSLPDLPFDAKKGMIVGGVVLALLLGYVFRAKLPFLHDNTPVIYNQAAFMWGKIRALRQDKKVKPEDWEMLKSELSPNINRHLTELKSTSGALAAKLVEFEGILQQILDKGTETPPDLFDQANTALQTAKAHMPKK